MKEAGDFRKADVDRFRIPAMYRRGNGRLYNMSFQSARANNDGASTTLLL